MRVKKATLTKRLAGFAVKLFPARMFRTIDKSMTMNAVAKSHMKTNKAIGKLSGKLLLFTASRIINGSTRRKLMIVADLRSVIDAHSAPVCEL